MKWKRDSWSSVRLPDRRPRAELDSSASLVGRRNRESIVQYLPTRASSRSSARLEPGSRLSGGVFSTGHSGPRLSPASTPPGSAGPFWNLLVQPRLGRLPLRRLLELGGELWGPEPRAPSPRLRARHADRNDVLRGRRSFRALGRLGRRGDVDLCRRPLRRVLQQFGQPRSGRHERRERRVSPRPPDGLDGLRERRRERDLRERRERWWGGVRRWALGCFRVRRRTSSRRTPTTRWTSSSMTDRLHDARQRRPPRGRRRTAGRAGWAPVPTCRSRSTATGVAFVSPATNLVPGDTNGEVDVFVHDVTTGRTEMVNLDSSGAQTFYTYGYALSGNGRFVAFAAIPPCSCPGHHYEPTTSSSATWRRV